MHGGLRTFVWLAILATAIGAGAVLYLAPGMDGANLQAALTHTLDAAFASPPWSWLPAVAGGAVIAASTLSIVDWAVTRPRARSSVHVRAGDVAGLREVIRDVQRRVEELTQYPPDVVQAWEELVRGAVRLEASDIHVSPTPESVKITYRVHGDLHDVVT